MEAKLPVYLDNNATTACDPRVVEAMLPFFTQHYGNPSGTHLFSWAAQEAVDIAREQVAGLIGADPVEIVFTSGATESIDLALKGVYENYTVKGNHIITVATEHKAVLETCMQLEKLGANITTLPVSTHGLVDLDTLENAITEHTILITVMYANNETGVIQPVRQIGAIAKKHNVFFFTDAAQAVGKVAIDVQEDGIDLMSVSGHKMYGPKGIGALYIRRKSPMVRLHAQIQGGGQERGLRSGTLNVPGIAGLGKACEICRNEMETEGYRLALLRNKLENALLELNGTTINSGGSARLPHVTNVSFGGVDGNSLLAGLQKQIAVSGGAACTSATRQPSHVLKAMGLNDDHAYSSVRFGLGRFTTEAQINEAIRIVKSEVLERQATHSDIHKTFV